MATGGRNCFGSGAQGNVCGDELRHASKEKRMKTEMVSLTISITVLMFLPQQGGGLVERLKELDRNGDGRLLAEEVEMFPRLGRFLTSAESDYDGTLSPAEIQPAFRNQAVGRLERDPLLPPPKGVVQKAHTLIVDGRERFFLVQAPKSPKGMLPVLFVFHGGGGQAENMLVRANFGELVAKENFLAVYPSAWQRHWNDGRNAPRIASQQEGVDDIKFVRAIVDELAKHHPIDRSRIFATGGSNGGIFCHYLAAKAADLFAGIAPIIGGLAEPVAADFEPSHPISLLVIQGDADPLVPIGGGPIAGSDRGGRIVSTERMLELYLKRNGITGEPTEELLPDADPNDGCRTRVRRWPPGEGGVKMEYWLIQGGGHTLPGTRSQRLDLLVGRTCRDFDFREAVWNFFKSCPPRAEGQR